MPINATMLTIYNGTNSSLIGLMTYGNTITGGYAGMLFVSGLWLVIFFGLSLYNRNDGAITASFTTLLVGILFTMIDYVPGEFVVANLVVLILLMVAKTMSSSDA
jgi:hypothetical protein